MGQATIKDVARRAGVDPSTVSRVLNSRLRGQIPLQTVERIKQAAQELEYVPHAAARALVAGRTQTIGLICFDLSAPYQGALAQAIQVILGERGHHMIVCSANRQSEQEAFYARLLSESRVDGVLVVGTASASELVAQHLKGTRRIPIVAAGPALLPETPDVFTACVVHDNRYGGFAIGQHLGTLGHRRIGCVVAGGFNYPHSRLRLQGLQAGLAAAGVPDEVRLSRPVENTYEGGFRATVELLDRHPELTALFAHNDLPAMGVLRALWEKGCRVPEDISVVGYHDLPSAAYTIPPLTTVRVPRERIARLATDLLFQALAGEEILQRQVVVEPEFVIRASTAAPRP